MLTEKDIVGMIEGYIKSPQGQADLKKSGINISGYSESEMKEIAADLRDAIIGAYLGVVRDPGKYFDVGATRINSPREQKDGTWKISVTFSDSALFRRSLCSEFPKKSGGATLIETSTGSGFFTGNGVYDIIGLFTQGYSARKNVYGTWWDNQYDDGDRGSLGTIRSLRYRSPNDFVSKTIADFKSKYPNIDVLYPALWGGTL